MRGAFGTRGWMAALLLAGCAGAPQPHPAVPPPVPASPLPQAEATAPPAEVAQIHVRLGVEGVLQGDRVFARMQFQKARELDPAHPLAGRLLALIERGDPAVARSATFRGIDLLNMGETDRAREELIAALCSDPGNQLARNLLDQIRLDPRQVLGEESFAYTVQPGESLSRIAQRFLDDKYLFYLLARYNGLDNPSRLRSGQVIRVPGVAPSIDPASETDTEAPRVYATPPGGVQPGPVSVVLTVEDERDPAPVVYYTRDGSPPGVGRGDRYEASFELRDTATVQFVAVDRDGNVSDVVSETYVVQTATEPAAQEPTVAELYQQGLTAVEQGDRDGALVLFDRVLERAPGHSAALETRHRVAAEGVEDWYRQAYAAMRRQRPRETVAYCDRVLAEAPDHRNAQVLRIQALDLIDHLVEVDLSEARAALQRGQRAEVARHVEKVLELDPNNGMALELLRKSQEEQ